MALSLTGRQPAVPQSDDQIEKLNGTFWRTIVLTAQSKKCFLANGRLFFRHPVAPVHIYKFNSSRKLVSLQWDIYIGSTLDYPTEQSKIRPNARSVKPTKYHRLVDELQLFECNPKNACVRVPGDRINTVSIYHLAPSSQVLKPLVVGHSETGEAPASNINTCQTSLVRALTN